MFTPSASSCLPASSAWARAAPAFPEAPIVDSPSGGRSGKAVSGPPSWGAAISGARLPAFLASAAMSAARLPICWSLTKFARLSTAPPQSMLANAATSGELEDVPSRPIRNSCET